MLLPVFELNTSISQCATMMRKHTAWAGEADLLSSRLRVCSDVGFIKRLLCFRFSVVFHNCLRKISMLVLIDHEGFSAPVLVLHLVESSQPRWAQEL